MMKDDWSRGISYTFTTSYTTVPVNYSVFNNGSDLVFVNEAVVNKAVNSIAKADKEFDAMEDQTSIAKQLLNDIGITWSEK